jgi:hypothetical protein
MLRALSLSVVGVCANVLVGLPAFAQAPTDVTPTRIDCGTGAQPTDVGQRFTDTFAYKDLELTFTFSCHLIEHGTDYMVWDTGFARRHESQRAEGRHRRSPEGAQCDARPGRSASTRCGHGSALAS